MTDTYLIDVSKDTSNCELLRLVECPACHADLSAMSVMAIHAHIGTHSSEDFGITGRGYRAGDNIGAEPDLREVVL